MVNFARSMAGRLRECRLTVARISISAEYFDSLIAHLDEAPERAAFMTCDWSDGKVFRVMESLLTKTVPCCHRYSRRAAGCLSPVTHAHPFHDRQRGHDAV